MDERSAEERACELGNMIRAAVDSGEFQLAYGYLHHGEKGCYGCAIAATAYVLGQRGNTADGRACRQMAVNSGLMCQDEALQLELGFEGWRRAHLADYGEITFAERINRPGWDRLWAPPNVEADESNPFYKLGAAMAGSRRL